MLGWANNSRLQTAPTQKKQRENRAGRAEEATNLERSPKQQTRDSKRRPSSRDTERRGVFMQQQGGGTQVRTIKGRADSQTQVKHSRKSTQEVKVGRGC